MSASQEGWGQQLLRQVFDGGSLSEQQSQHFVSLVLTEGLSAPVAAALLTLLAQRGETPAELAGGLAAVTQQMVPLPLTVPNGQKFFDVVGTGGDGKRCLNVSTATALCLAAMGHPCAKHGNRAQSGLVGSADILRLCGVPVDLQGQQAHDFFRQHDFVFLQAPLYHPAFRHAAPLRQALRLPTLFNLLGPLANPSQPPALAVGAASPAKAKLLSAAAPPDQQAVCYCSQDGYDELSTAAPTDIFYRGQLVYTVNPADYFAPCPMPQVRDSDDAVRLFRQALSGQDHQLNRLLALNLALCLAWLVPPQGPPKQHWGQNLAAAYPKAEDLVRSGAALRKLERISQ